MTAPRSEVPMRITSISNLLLALGAVVVTATPRTAAGQLPADFGNPSPINPL